MIKLLIFILFVLFHVPTVVRIRRKKTGEIVTGCDVYIGRRFTQGGWDLQASIWANRFTPKDMGSVEAAVAAYEMELRQKIVANPDYWRPYFHAIVTAGRSLSLGCWCKDKPDNPCHGDVIVKLCKEYISSLAVPIQSK